ncbi:MAG TPA: formyltransferase family protein [Thermomicrobiales bacterium]|nr:formyltransferase family protein [Thermomicrobiales bacterium]
MVNQTSSESWRIVVLTNIMGGAVYRLVDSVATSRGHRVVGVVTTPGPPKRRDDAYLSVVQAVRPGIDTIVTSHPSRIAGMIAPMRPDLLISGGFPWLLPESVRMAPRVAAINMHPSLLPRHRGPQSIPWVFRSGDTEIGLTVHMLDGSFDTGPILAQGSVPIEISDDAMSMVGRLIDATPEILNQAFARLEQGERGDPQDESLATEAPTFESEWRLVDWQQPALAIHNQVRSWTGMRGTEHGALANIRGRTVNITRTNLTDKPGGRSNAQPGDILDEATDRLIVQCGDGPLEVLAWSVA